MNKKQTSKNLFSNIITLIVNVTLGFFYTPYLVKSLGIAAYGIIPLALIINQYINVLTGSITGSLTRFYSIALQQGKTLEASKYLSTIIAAILIFIALLLPLAYIVIIKIDSLFNIPLEYIDNARTLFAFTLLSFFLSLISSALNITLYALNRLDLLNVISILRTTFKVTAAILFLEMLDKNIAYIGIATLVAELSVFITSIYYFILTTNHEVKIKINYFDMPKLATVLAMTTWIIIIQIGDIGLQRVDIILVNIFWGTKETGILGALSEFGTYITSIVSVFSSLFGPLILLSYSREDHNEVKRIIKNNALIIGILTACIVGLFMGFSNEITELWLGKEFTSYSIWLIFKLLHIPFFMVGGMFTFVFRSWNMIKLPAIFTIVIGIVNFSVLLLMYKYGHRSAYTITLSLLFSSLLIICQTYLFGIWYMKRIYPDSKYTPYIRTTISICIALCILYILSKIYIFYFISIINLQGLMVGISIVGLTGLTFVWFFIISREQKQYLLKEVLINKYSHV